VSRPTPAARFAFTRTQACPPFCSLLLTYGCTPASADTDEAAHMHIRIEFLSIVAGLN